MKFKRVFLVIGLISILLLTVYGCNDTNKYKGDYFSFNYPSNWEIDEQNMNSNIKSISLVPEDETEEMILSIEVDFSGRDLDRAEYRYTEEDFSKEMDDEYAKLKNLAEFTGAIEVHRQEELEVDGQPARQMVFSQDDIIYNTIVIYKANRNSILLYAAREDLYEQNKEQKEILLESLEFKF